MHYAGVDLKLSVEHAAPVGSEPADECLMQTPRWDFEYQYAYAFDAEPDAAPRIGVGDILKLRCTYTNNIDENEHLREALEAEEREVADLPLGEASNEEMCIAILGLSYKL